MDISSIDDLLGSNPPVQSFDTENDYPDKPEEIKEVSEDASDKEEYDYGDNKEADEKQVEIEAKDDDEIEAHEDEYGNKELMSKNMRKRMKKLQEKHDAEISHLRSELAHQGASQQVQQAAKDFEYDPNDDASWEQQLSELVKKTVNGMEQDNLRAKQKQIEIDSHREFESKFHQGMGKFDDFREVVGSQPIDDAMTLALRGMNDPASFIYAASKRSPQELERISKLRDPYARMVEMGKLEERMRRNKPATQSPRPLGRTKEDAAIPHQKGKKEDGIEDLIAKSEKMKIAKISKRRGR